jgi:hypothetical protein
LIGASSTSRVSLSVVTFVEKCQHVTPGFECHVRKIQVILQDRMNDIHQI